MKKLTIPIIFALSLGLFLITLITTNPSQASPNQPAGTSLIGADIYTSRQIQEGIVSTSNLINYGPNICTSYGDPFSPFNSQWAPGIYSYRFRIEIPPDYEQAAETNYLRVELFDPDSINNENNNTTIRRTDAAVIAGGLSAFASANCPSTSRKNVCLINTAEAPNGVPVGGLDLNQVNPFWFLRVDENRGTTTPGQCGEPSTYTEAYNTATRFELYYYTENSDGTEQRTPLASYTGQTGQETFDHETDLHWVSPGANVSFAWNKTTGNLNVPTDPGTHTERGFEIDLSREIPGIVTDSATGSRYIYLDVTALSGASENGFEIWAGPEYYTDSISSYVNDRNVQLLNQPWSHSSHGVNVFAMGYLPLNSNANYRLDMPLTYLTPEQAGESVYVSIFDIDAGAQPPITFYLDSIAEEDWSLTFGNGGLDPDGITSTLRCFAGANASCNNEWLDPPYEIKLPYGTQNCDFNNPTTEDCTPFYGGRLYARVKNGAGDTYGWQVSISQDVPDNPTCDAFPIAVHEGARSVTQAQYPSTSQGPNLPPYNSFIHHQDNLPLLQAAEGTVFLLQNGLGDGSFGWLTWNQGINASANTLADSLTWPGNIYDYTNHGDDGSPVSGSGFAHVVRGYIEAIDPTDTQLHIGDWVFANTGAVNSLGVQEALNDHITLDRILRLPIWNASQQQGNNGVYKASGYGLFRVHGYQFGQTSWILLEFIRFDESCGQPYVPPTAVSSVTINGTTYTAPNSDETFTADILPITATQPVSYTWEATGFAPVTHSGSISDTISFNWSTTGSKTITVTAENAGGIVTETHTLIVSDLVQGKDLIIIGTPQLITPLPVDEGQPLTFEITVRNNSTEDIASHWFVDLFVNPGTINPDGIPAAESKGFTTLSALDSGESKTVSITLNDGLPMPNMPHQIYAMVDTFKNITEVNETNNISQPLSFGANNFIEWSYLYLPVILKP